MEIKDLIKENAVFHCDTEEKANELLRKAHELGYKWCNGVSYLKYNNWHHNKEDTCYDIYGGHYGYIYHYKKNNYIIIEYILDKDLEEKSMDRIIDGKDLVNEKIEVYKDGTMKIHKPLGEFVPKMDECYYFIDDCGGVICDTWSDWNEDKWRLKHYKLFRTEEECKDYKWFLEMIDKYSYEFSVEEWKNRNIDKYTFEFSFEHDEIITESWFYTKLPTYVYFKDKQFCEEFISLVGKERIKKYIFNIWD